jgi:osmotically-inducible protein OsmY
MKSNSELQKDVQDAIKWEPLLHSAEIGVIVKDGIVTLTGTVDSYPKKLEAENAAKKVTGIKALVEKIEVRFTNSWSKSNDEVALEAVNAVMNNKQVPYGKVLVTVENGWVTLDGTLPWNYQKDAANHSVKYLEGVKGVINNIKIKSESQDIVEQKTIEAALGRNWSINANDINVSVFGTKVKLTGTVGSWFQKEEAGRIAWNTPGIWTLENDLEIEYDYTFAD